eukprot:UN10368
MLFICFSMMALVSCFVIPTRWVFFFWTLMDLTYSGNFIISVFLMMDCVAHEEFVKEKLKFENVPRVHIYLRFALHAVLSYYVWPWLTWFLFCVHSKLFREVTMEYFRFPMSSWTDKRSPFLRDYD